MSEEYKLRQDADGFKDYREDPDDLDLSDLAHTPQAPANGGHIPL